MNIWYDINLFCIILECFIVCIEIIKGSKKKYELDKEIGMIILDRVLYILVYYLVNYGFIFRIYVGDNDLFDVLVLCQEDIELMFLVEVYLIGVIKMIDSDEVDEKIIVIFYGDLFMIQYKDLKGLLYYLFFEIFYFFEVYKFLEGKKIYIFDIELRDEVIKVVFEVMVLYDKVFINKKEK